MKQGDRDVTFNSNNNNEIPNEIKALLPHYASVV
jgi:hypothetical protein